MDNSVRGHIAALVVILLMQLMQPAQAQADAAALFLIVQASAKTPEFVSAPSGSTGCLVVGAGKHTRDVAGKILVCDPSQNTVPDQCRVIVEEARRFDPQGRLRYREAVLRQSRVPLR